MFWSLTGLRTALIREMSTTTTLAVGEVQDLNVAHIGQMTLDPIASRGKDLFIVYATGVDQEPAALKPFIRQDVAEGASRPSLLYGVGRHVEHHKSPHRTIC